MPRKQIVTEDPDDEMEMEVEEEGEKLFPHLSEWAVENELNLPSQLKGQMKSREKRELLEYKRSHNEVSMRICFGPFFQRFMANPNLPYFSYFYFFVDDLET